MLVNSELRIALPIFILICVIGAFQKRRRSSQAAQFYTTLPCVGIREGSWLAWTRGILSSITRSADYALAGYQKYSGNGLPFVVPSTGCGAIVVLSPSQLHVLNKSSNEVQAIQAQFESHQPRYTMGDQAAYADMLHFDLVRNQLTKNVGFFASMTQDELSAALDDYCGNSKEWKTVNAWDFCTKVIARAGNRTYVGLPLCRNEELLEQSRLYATAVYGAAAVITALPSFIRPVLGHLVSLPAQRYLSRCKKVLVPFVQDRLDKLDDGNGDGPDDVLQWLIIRCAKAGSEHLDASKIAERLLILNLVSIYTTTYSFAYCMLDIYGSPHKEDYVAGLRAECDRVSAQHNGLSTKEAIDDLFRVDSAIRESLRISAFGILALFRNVTPGSSLELHDGVRIPGGVRIGVPCQPIHLDESQYSNAAAFDAFRFSRPFEGPEGAKRQGAEQKLSVTLDDSFLTYGYGKHACPGRWFASQMMKQAIAHVIQHYDVEVVGELPKRQALLNMVMPPEKAQIRIRKRT